MIRLGNTKTERTRQPLVNAATERFPSHGVQSPRLQRLRQAMLDAPYGLCTEKASLLTEYFSREQPRQRGIRHLQRLHARAFVSALDTEDPPHPLARRVNRRLMSAYERLEGLSPEETAIKYAGAFDHIVTHMPLVVYDDELIVGNASSHRIGAPLHPEYSGLLLLPEIEALSSRSSNPIQVQIGQSGDLQQNVAPMWFDRSIMSRVQRHRHVDVEVFTHGTAYVLTQFAGISHCTPDYPTLLKLGFRGLEKQILAEQRRCPSPFHDAALTTVRAAIAHGRRWRRKLLQMAEDETNAERRDDLLQMADVMKVVPEHPAKTFHQALQSIIITHSLLHWESFQHGMSFGRLDQYLWPFYKNDRLAGRITPDQATELIGCFLAKSAELLPLFFHRATEYFSGLSSAAGITLAGRTTAGEDAVNDLSFLIIRAYDQIRLRQPNIHVRFFKGTNPRFKRLCYQTIKSGGGIPAIFNDEAIVDAMEGLGSREEVLDFAIVGCAEWGIPYSSFPAAGAGFINLPYALLLALNNGMDEGRQAGPATGDPTTWTTLEQLIQAFQEQLTHQLTQATAANNIIESTHAQHRPTPFLSTLIDGCIASGRDVTSGGALHNSTGFMAVGLADVVDSLLAIDNIVYRQRQLSLPAFIKAVADDFVGHEALHARLTNRTPRYGEDEANTLLFSKQVSAIFVEELGRFRNPRGGPYLPGFWTMTTHQGFGSRLPALPSGRLAGQPLANGICPQLGNERQGPTAALRAAAAITPAKNGCVLNMKLDPEYVEGDKGDTLMDALVTGYFREGGMQLQFNVIDPAILLKARENPQDYRDLVVRVSGYSAYYVDLTPEMQDELLARATHGRDSCHMPHTSKTRQSSSPERHRESAAPSP
ncbi:MAG: hypothetical protein HN348_06910 [Proteobacteria bacterium]|nr:hypothetical protein [Pseudomonadota bacterium]